MNRRAGLGSVRCLAVAAGALMLSACMDSRWARRETISPDGGDAVASNIAVQMLDPWPAGAWDKTIRHDGTRGTNAIDAYRTPPPAPPVQPLAGQSITEGLTTD